MPKKCEECGNMVDVFLDLCDECLFAEVEEKPNQPECAKCVAEVFFAGWPDGSGE